MGEWFQKISNSKISKHWRMPLNKKIFFKGLKYDANSNELFDYTEPKISIKDGKLKNICRILRHPRDSSIASLCLLDPWSFGGVEFAINRNISHSEVIHMNQ